MSYRDCLNTFLTVYRLGSQNRAAEALALTQPAVSQHLKMLEQYLNKPLFTRAGRGLQPTAVAHQLAFNISDALDTLTDELATMKQGTRSLSGDVIVGGLSAFFTKIIIPVLPALTEVDIRLRYEIDHSTLLERLLNNELNLAQFTTHVVHPQITIEKLYHQKFVLVGHPKFKKRIAKKQLDQNDITSLMQLPWIAYSEILLFIKEYFHTVFHREFHGELKLVIPDLWAMLAAVTAGVGITILPSYFCQEMLAEKKIALLYETPKAPSHFFYIGWKQGALRDPKIKFVYDLFKHACAQT